MTSISIWLVAFINEPLHIYMTRCIYKRQPPYIYDNFRAAKCILSHIRHASSIKCAQARTRPISSHTHKSRVKLILSEHGIRSSAMAVNPDPATVQAISTALAGALSPLLQQAHPTAIVAASSSYRHCYSNCHGILEYCNSDRGRSVLAAVIGTSLLS